WSRTCARGRRRSPRRPRARRPPRLPRRTPSRRLPRSPDDPVSPAPSWAGIRLERSRDGARADLRIELPPPNVPGLAALRELARVVSSATDVRVLVLSGLPKAFSAGVDVADHAPEPEAIRRMLAAMREVLEALVAVPAVTLASVRGACLGGGA